MENYGLVVRAEGVSLFGSLLGLWWFFCLFLVSMHAYDEPNGVQEGEASEVTLCYFLCFSFPISTFWQFD